VNQKYRDDWVPVFERVIKLNPDEGTFMIKLANVLSELSPAWEDYRPRIIQRISALSHNDRSTFMIEVAKLFMSFASYKPDKPPPAWMDEERVACFVDDQIEGWPLLWEYPKPPLPARTGKAGRPKTSEEQRREMNPIHSAAEEFYMIREVLRQWYRKPPRAIHQRALELAAARNAGRTPSGRVVRPDSLDAHLNRTKTNRRRVPLRVVL